VCVCGSVCGVCLLEKCSGMCVREMRGVRCVCVCV